jgi:hypothetical protein
LFPPEQPEIPEHLEMASKTSIAVVETQDEPRPGNPRTILSGEASISTLVSKNHLS